MAYHCILWLFLTIILSTPFVGLSQSGTRGLIGEQPGVTEMSRTLALIVGISDYQFIENLKYADRDARIFEEFLATQKGGSVQASNMRALYNADATHDKIYEGLDWLADNVESEDRVFFYFSGHGDVESMFNKPKGYLLAHDSPTNSYRAGAVRMTDVTEFLTAISETGAEVIFIADACRSGNLAGGKQGATAVINHLEQPWGEVIKMLSCGQDELSLESSKIGGGRGLFSYHLMEGLAGEAESQKDGKINLYELGTYVKNKVIADASPSPQYPKFFGNERIVISEFDDQSLSLWKNNTNESSADLAFNGTRGSAGESVSDLNIKWIKEIEQFNRHLEIADAENQRLTSVLSTYRSFMKAHPTHKYGGVMKRKLVSDFVSESQEMINGYVNGAFEYMADFKQLFKPVNAKLDSCLKLMDESDKLYQEVKSKALFTRVLANNFANDQDAIEALQTAVSIDPMASYFYHLLGKYQAKTKQSDAAIESFEMAINLSPKWFYPYNNLGLLFQSLGQVERAQENYQTASELNPKDPSAFNNLGSAYLNKGDLENAIASFQQAVNLSPNNDAYRFRLGDAYLTKGDNQLALEAYTAALDLNPNDDLIYDRLAYIHLKNGDDGRGLKAMLKAAELDNSNPNYFYNLACFYARTGKAEKGLENLGLALEKGWNDKSHMIADPDLKTISDSDAFKQLIARFFPE